MPFAKGQSGNPGGRPKALVEVQEAARSHTPMALATLARIADDKTAPPAAQVAAANALLDRGWGKPVQTVDVPVHQPSPIEERLRGASVETLRVLRDALAQAEAEASGEVVGELACDDY